MSNGFADAFIEEGREHLTEIENNLIVLEDNPGEEEAMNQVFRSAHTLKGNAGAMGFEQFSKLAHEIEEVLDGIRSGNLELTSEVVDDLFDAADAMRQMLTEIEDEGECSYEGEEEINQLLAISQSSDENQCVALTNDGERCSLDVQDDDEFCWQHLKIIEEQGEEAIERYDQGDESKSLEDEEESESTETRVKESDIYDIDSTLELVETPEEPVPNAYHIAVEIDGNNQTVLEALSDAFEVLITVPSIDKLENEPTGSFGTIIVGNISSSEDISNWFDPMSDVSELEVTELTDRVDWVDEEQDEQTEDDLAFDSLDDLDDFVGTSDFDEVEEVGEDTVSDVELGMDEVGDSGTFDTAEVDSPIFEDDSEIDLDESSDKDDLPDNKGARIFDELSGEVDEAESFDEIEQEMEEMGFGEEFDEMDDEEEIGFEELLEADPDEMDFEEDDSTDDGAGLFDDAASEEPAGLFAENDDEEDGSVDDGDTEIEVSEELDISNDEEDEIVGAGFDDDPFADIESGTGISDSEPDEESEGIETEPIGIEENTDDIFGSEFDDTGSVNFDDLLREAGEQREVSTGEKSETIESIRVSVDQLDEMYSLMQELVTSRIRLRRAISQDTESQELSQAFDELDTLDMITSRMQDTVMDIRLVRFGRITDRLPRVVRDTARENDKDVSFEIDGEDVELDRAILEQIGDPLMHLVRNAVDHGIEHPDVREERGKDPEGKLNVQARRTRDRVTITIEDDGGGINPKEVRSKAVDEGILPEEQSQQFDDEQVLDLIFHPGFSTKSDVSETSGRGVGLDVVYTTIRSLDGTVDVASEIGKGTKITMRLPVSLAIDEVLLIEAGGEEYGIPIKNISEITTIQNIEKINGQLSHIHDGDVYPLVSLHNALGTPNDVSGGHLIRIDKNVRPIAIQCDNVIESTEVVVEPYDGVLRTIPGLSGAAVLGEGDVVNILDVERL